MEFRVSVRGLERRGVRDRCSITCRGTVGYVDDERDRRSVVATEEGGGAGETLRDKLFDSAWDIGEEIGVWEERRAILGCLLTCVRRRSKRKRNWVKAYDERTSGCEAVIEIGCGIDRNNRVYKASLYEKRLDRNDLAIFTSVNKTQESLIGV